MDGEERKKEKEKKEKKWKMEGPREGLYNFPDSGQVRGAQEEIARESENDFFTV